AARRRSDDSSNWTPQKGLIFLGLVILVFSSALAGIFGMSMPSEQPIHVNYDSIRERANALSLNDSMKEWHDLRGGLRKDELNSMVRFRAIQESYRRWVYISIGGCVIGALLCIIGVATSGMSLRVPQ
ncbi:MAG: hypothetical protein KDA63_08925, partial [Planctomycetales bacterium]|nr:hypothetical protein [Planctomycetales bacterium]